MLGGNLLTYFIKSPHTHTMYTVKRLTTGRLNVVHCIAIQLHHFWRLRFLLLVVTHSKCILRYLHKNIVPLLPFFPHCFSNCIKITETHTILIYIMFHTHWNVCVFMLGLRFSQRCCWIFKSSGMLCCVADVSKDHTAFIFRVKQSRMTKPEDTAIWSLKPSDTSQTPWIFVYPCFTKVVYILVTSIALVASENCRRFCQCHTSHNYFVDNLLSFKHTQVGSDIIMFSVCLCVSWHFNYRIS